MAVNPANILAYAKFLAPGPTMTRRDPHTDLSRRERQIMDVVYRRGAATAAEITADLPDPPTSTAVRTMLRILEDKGHLTHDQDGVRYVYRATLDRDKARESVLTHVLKTFFNGSAEQAMVTLIDRSGSDLTDDELARLAGLIAKARKRRDPRK
jgi:BlaI family penicillinase repressor